MVHTFWFTYSAAVVAHFRMRGDGRDSCRCPRLRNTWIFFCFYLSPMAVGLLLPAYILARGYLVVKCFMNLSHLPAGIFRRSNLVRLLPSHRLGEPPLETSHLQRFYHISGTNTVDITAEQIDVSKMETKAYGKHEGGWQSKEAVSLFVSGLEWHTNWRHDMGWHGREAVPLLTNFSSDLDELNTRIFWDHLATNSNRLIYKLSTIMQSWYSPNFLYHFI